MSNKRCNGSYGVSFIWARIQMDDVHETKETSQLRMKTLISYEFNFIFNQSYKYNFIILNNNNIKEWW